MKTENFFEVEEKNRYIHGDNYKFTWKDYWKKTLFQIVTILPFSFLHFGA